MDADAMIRAAARAHRVHDDCPACLDMGAEFLCFVLQAGGESATLAAVLDAVQAARPDKDTVAAALNGGP